MRARPRSGLGEAVYPVIAKRGRARRRSHEGTGRSHSGKNPTCDYYPGHQPAQAQSGASRMNHVQPSVAVPQSSPDRAETAVAAATRSACWGRPAGLCSLEMTGCVVTLTCRVRNRTLGNRWRARRLSVPRRNRDPDEARPRAPPPQPRTHRPWVLARWLLWRGGAVAI
jgi:hypothetical protein